VKLYLLTRKNVRSMHEFRAFVICGLSAADAREQAYGAEKHEDWLVVDQSTIMVIGRPSGPITDPQIILAERV
jgi:hypothetical protein